MADIPPFVNENDIDSLQTPTTTGHLSKNELKRRKKAEYFQEKKKLRKEMEKQKRKDKRKLKASQSNNESSSNCHNDDNNNDNNNDNTNTTNRSRVFSKDEYLLKCNQNFSIIIDCAFEEYHTEKALKSVGQQILFCYGMNRRSINPVHFYLTGLGPKLLEHTTKCNAQHWVCAYRHSYGYETLISEFSKDPPIVNICTHTNNTDNHHDSENYANITLIDTRNTTAVSSMSSPPSSSLSSSSSTTIINENESNTCEENHPSTIALFSLPPIDTTTTTTNTIKSTTCIPKNMRPKQLIYLTSDAEDTIEELDNNCAYIIGGIVDRNQYKGLTYRKAIEQGIRTAKLPIREHIEQMKGTHILTINHVFDLLLTYATTKNWKITLEKVLPLRKK